MKISSDDIKRLLAEKHSGDIYVHECKNGPTHLAVDLLKLDGWAMSRSWANPRTCGYEIKVSRSDWVNDKKWVKYIPLVNEMWVVSPRDLVKPAELPAGVGLIYVASTGTRLYTKVKAVWKDIEPPVDLLNYVLMCRASIDIREYRNTRDDWEAYFAAEHDDRRFGRLLAYRIRERFEQCVTRVSEENSRLKREIEALKPLREELVRRGIYYQYSRAEKLADKLEADESIARDALERAKKAIEAAELLIDKNR